MLKSGKSFGEQAIHGRSLQNLALRADTVVEYAILTREGYELSLRSVAD